VGNDLVVRILEVSELGHALHMRESRSHVWLVAVLECL
jgi:hypothetical protein